MSKYLQCKQVFEDAINFLNSNSYSNEQFVNIIKELTQDTHNYKRIVTILLCTFLQDYCHDYKLDRAYSLSRHKYHNQRTTQEELANIILALQGGRADDYTDDLKRIAREM